MLLKNQRTFNKHEIYGILKDYNWIVKEANRINLQLEGVESYGVQIITDEPKASGYNNKLEAETIRREKKYKRMEKHMQKIDFMNERSKNITDEKECAVLDCILDGMSLTQIAIHLNISRRHTHQLRDSIVDKLSVGN